MQVRALISPSLLQLWRAKVLLLFQELLCGGAWGQERQGKGGENGQWTGDHTEVLWTSKAWRHPPLCGVANCAEDLSSQGHRLGHGQQQTLGGWGRRRNMSPVVHKMAKSRVRFQKLQVKGLSTKQMWRWFSGSWEKSLERTTILYIICTICNSKALPALALSTPPWRTELARLQQEAREAAGGELSKMQPEGALAKGCMPYNLFIHD